MSTDTKSVFELLNSLRSGIAKVEEAVKADDVAGPATVAAVVMAEPEPSLIHPLEPNFQEGYEIKTPSGHVITMTDVWNAYVAGENILIVGPTGCGKSSLAFHMLDKANEVTRVANRKVYNENLTLAKAGKELKLYHALPYEHVHFSCHEGTRSESLIGTVKVRINDKGDREALVVYGSVVEAWTKGRTLILEEMDFAPAGVWGETHQFFDGRTTETDIFVNGQERITKKNRFRVIATANTLGRGENQMEYAGTQLLNTAFLNRFTYIVKLGWLPATAESKLLQSKAGIISTVADKLIAAATQSRAAYEAQTCDICISTRDLLSWSRECARGELKIGKDIAKKLSMADYWNKIVVPAAYPTFLSRIVDKATLTAFNTYLTLR